jgi:hypothetical protein
VCGREWIHVEDYGQGGWLGDLDALDGSLVAFCPFFLVRLITSLLPSPASSPPSAAGLSANMVPIPSTSMVPIPDLDLDLDLAPNHRPRTLTSPRATPPRQTPSRPHRAAPPQLRSPPAPNLHPPLQPHPQLQPPDPNALLEPPTPPQPPMSSGPSRLLPRASHTPATARARPRQR